jgi:ApbE superfamily uncharacterized protein (UPF0280 family)
MIKEICGVQGALVIIGERIGVWGKVKLVSRNIKF